MAGFRVYLIMPKNKSTSEKSATGIPYINRDGEQIHPEDEIFRVKAFVGELGKVQEQYFEKLCGELKIESERGRELLFDYVYNSEHLDGFEDYLAKLGYTYEEWLALGA